MMLPQTAEGQLNVTDGYGLQKPSFPSSKPQDNQLTLESKSCGAGGYSHYKMWGAK